MVVGYLPLHDYSSHSLAFIKGSVGGRFRDKRTRTISRFKSIAGPAVPLAVITSQRCVLEESCQETCIARNKVRSRDKTSHPVASKKRYHEKISEKILVEATEFLRKLFQEFGLDPPSASIPDRNPQ